MTISAIPFAPGIVADDSDTASEGRYIAADGVRFRRGKPESIGGWEAVTTSTVSGVCRGLYMWADATGAPQVGIGTHSKLYAYSGGGLYDITPTTRRSLTLGSNPIATTNASTTVTITDTAHGALIGDTVTFSGATATGGLTISGAYSVTSIPTANTYTITAASPASSTATGGGAAVVATYAFMAGNADGTGGAGYGTGSYGVGTYGTSSNVQYFPRTWSLDAWGSHLIACPRGGAIYEWSGATGTPAARISGAPTTVNSAFVTPERILVACGTTEYAGTYNPLLVRWSAQEDNTNWTPAATNLSGEYPLSQGSRIVRGLVGRGESLIWTDTALVAMRFDPTYAYAFQTVAVDCGLIGPNAAAVVSGAAFWITPGGQFYGYSGGAAQALDCPIRDAVFDHLSYVQADKIYAFVNGAYGEVWWVYPDARDGNEISRYVAYNYAEGTWTTGTTTRTAWCDAGAWPSPMAVDYSGALYFHERGNSANGGVLPWSLSTGYTDMGDGDNLVQLAGLRPDFKDLQGAVSLTVLTRSDPQATPASHGPYTISASTTKVDIRATGRQIALQWSGTGAPAFFRMGSPRFDVKPLGARR